MYREIFETAPPSRELLHRQATLEIDVPEWVALKVSRAIPFEVFDYHHDNVSNVGESISSTPEAQVIHLLTQGLALVGVKGMVILSDWNLDDRTRMITEDGNSYNSSTLRDVYGGSTRMDRTFDGNSYPEPDETNFIPLPLAMSRPYFQIWISSSMDDFRQVVDLQRGTHGVKWGNVRVIDLRGYDEPQCGGDTGREHETDLTINIGCGAVGRGCIPFEDMQEYCGNGMRWGMMRIPRLATHEANTVDVSYVMQCLALLSINLLCKPELLDKGEWVYAREYLTRTVSDTCRSLGIAKGKRDKVMPPISSPVMNPGTDTPAPEDATHAPAA